jgi:hypothetical protein
MADSTFPSYDILITSIPHRHEKLLELLACLDRQIEVAPPAYFLYGVGAIIYRDNLSVPYGDKTRALLEASSANYVSCVDDDDLLLPGSVSRIMAALRTRPDYVGFRVKWTKDGEDRIAIEHSLRHAGWSDSPDLLCRDLSEKNPVRRELALLGTWSGGYEAERRWAEGVRASGKCVTEAWIPEEVYWYRESSADTFKTPRSPLPPEQIPPLPAYPWLRVLDAEGSC